MTKARLPNLSSPSWTKPALLRPRLNPQTLLAEIEAQKSLMIIVATGGPRINEVFNYVSVHRRAQPGLCRYGRNRWNSLFGRYATRQLSLSERPFGASADDQLALRVFCPGAFP
jgi:hypothetical protein